MNTMDRVGVIKSTQTRERKSTDVQPASKPISSRPASQQANQQPFSQPASQLAAVQPASKQISLTDNVMPSQSALIH